MLDSLTARQLLDSSTDLDSYSTLRPALVIPESASTSLDNPSTSLDRLNRNSTGMKG